MASDWPGPRIDFARFAEALEKRRIATGITELPRNAGANRTASKRALLRAIEEAGGRW